MIRLTHEDVQRRLTEISTQIQSLYEEQEYLVGIKDAFVKVQEECLKYEKHIEANAETTETEVDHIDAFINKNSIIEYLDVRDCLKERLFRQSSIRTMSDLMNAKDSELLNIQGIGRKALNEIRYAEEMLLAEIRNGWSDSRFSTPEQEFLYRKQTHDAH